MVTCEHENRTTDSACQHLHPNLCALLVKGASQTRGTSTTSTILGRQRKEGSKSSGPDRWGCSFKGVPLPYLTPPPRHFPVMAPSEATPQRKSHRQGEKRMCASTLHKDAHLARGPPSLGRERRGSATGSFSLAWFSPKSSFSTEVSTFLFSLRCVRPQELPSGSALKAQENETGITDASSSTGIH